jgi:alpha-beta hydrolase superfamily lysophospholipase
MEELVVAVDGAAIHVEYRPSKSKIAVLVTHGLNSDIRELGDLPASLHEAGVAVYAFDQRGFGRSTGERGKVDLGRFTNTVDSLIERIRADGYKKIIGVGHSLGASLMIGYASRGDFDGLVVAHPVRCLWDELTRAEKLYFGFVGKRGNKRTVRGAHAGYAPYTVRPRHMAREPHAVQHIKDLDFIQTKINAAIYGFGRTMNAEQWARRVQCPVLAISSVHDKVVDPAGTLRVIQAITTEVTHVDHMGGHSCFLDQDRAHVIDEIVHWVTS